MPTLKSEPLPASINCPHCGANMELDDQDRAAKKFVCPACGKPIDYNNTPYSSTAAQAKKPRSGSAMMMFPNLEGDEMMYVQGLVKEMSDDQANQFASYYNSRRKDPQTILLTTLVGFLGFAGIQRFMLGQIGMGLLYLFTCGFCFIGTIIDLATHKKLAFEANSGIAQQTAMMVKSSS
jgi:TM2 domain-containing membrane protein YozV/endogenous inhibitor of DNA gyrase (YacG/DUF329 family)